MSETLKKQNSRVLIRGIEEGGWRFLDEITEFLQYKDLLFHLVKRDVTVLYKQSVIGMGWAIIRPLAQVLIFTVFFGGMAGISEDIGVDVPYGVWSFAGLLPWTFFAASLGNSTNSLVAGKEFISKVYFPRIILPVAPIFAKGFDFLISLIFFFALAIFMDVSFNLNLLFLPFLLFWLILTSLGISLWLSALSIQYRDVSQMLQFLIQLLMYLSPVIWPITYIPEKYQLYYGLYPMAGLIEGFRASLLGYPQMPYELMASGFLVSLLILLGGFIFFKNRERLFADVV